MKETDDNDNAARLNLFAVVLAAGQASRFGSSKQLAVYRGQSLVRRATAAAEAVCGQRSLLVAGNDWQRVTASAAPLRGFFVVNDRHEDGMSTSIAAACRVLPDTADALLLMLADQPLVGEEILAALIGRWRQDPARIVGSRYAGVTGPPVIFPRDCFAELASLEGDRGAQAVVRRHAHRVSTLDVDEAAIDIDSSADLAALED